MNTMLLSAIAAARFSTDTTIKVVREDPEYIGIHWVCLCENSDWVGFQDDYGNFIPAYWC